MNRAVSTHSNRTLALAIVATAILASLAVGEADADGLTAGVARIDITDRQAGPVNDPLYVKALMLKDGSTTLAVVTVDAVAIGELGRIGNDYLPAVRSRLESELGIKPSNVLVNASHCHGVVCADVAERTFQAVKDASQNMLPVNIGAGAGREERIMENRRFKLKDGKEADARRAYALPPDDAIAGVGPVDPAIGVLRLDRKDGRPLAVIYNFACHPIEGTPSGGNSADITGFASKAIEESLGEGAIALFLQGCAGDINPARYKDVERPRDAEPLGAMLGLSALRALREIQPKQDDRLLVINETIELPRADHAQRIAAMETEQTRLLQSLKGTDINLKTFLPLAVKYNLSGEFPSYYAHRYLHEDMMGRDDLKKLDAQNRESLKQYIENIRVMEELTRLQANLDLLRKHQADNQAASQPAVETELLGIRIGDFVLVTFPGELSVQIGLNIKKASPHPLTFVAGYTNGYIYYAPTAEQLANVGCAQEDCDTILAIEWQKLFEEKASDILKRL